MKCFVVATLAVLWAIYFVHVRKREPLSTDVIYTRYDFIIVGGGTAGCILAARLSEDPNFSVLLLEAGNDDRNKATMQYPGLFPELWSGEDFWMDLTVPQRHACFGFKNNQCRQPHGKVLGGGSSVNGMMYVRGSPHDYDEWARYGATGWSYKDVLPYFKKAENFQVPSLQNSEFHGYSGPTVVQVPAWSDMSKAWVEAAKEINFEAVDSNSDKQEGLGLIQQSVNNGIRSSMPSAYLEAARGRPNLNIATRAFVNKVIIKQKRAVGVEFLWKGEKHRIHAKKEVIVSAGALDSPKVLMLSGIGHKEHLKEHKIPVVADLPVGDNLQDHLWIAVQYTLDNCYRPTATMSNIQYLVNGGGPLGSSFLEAQAFFRPDSQPQNSLIPYGQVVLGNGIILNDDYTRKIGGNFFNMREEQVELIHGKYNGQNGLEVCPVLLHPKSNGTVRLASSLPSDRPLLDPNYLVEPQDVLVLLDAIRLGQKILNTEAFKKLGPKIVQYDHPFCNIHEFDSDAFWKCVIRHDPRTVFHPAGTCKMGAENDPTAVVDPKLRVKGVRGLRVIDASIMPHVTAGNTNAPTIMIAEKGADIIKGDYRST